MSSLDKLQENWASKRLKRAMLKLRKEMDPHADKAETIEGMRAMLLVAGITQLVVSGLETEVYLEKSIQLASDISDIPKSAFTAYANFIKAGHSGYVMSLRTSPFTGGDNV
ncbi:MAG: hypothetical protein HN731_16480 [Rhodospirillaceae bacterium]|jgi:hypothetical protein|nr:hypothetical protein [Rhodospirillaceae bacterium]